MMMLAILLSLLGEASAAQRPIDPLPRQTLPASGCAAYLFQRGEAGVPPTFVAMAGTDPAQLRLSLNGAMIDLPRTAQSGVGGYGFAGVTDYGAGGVTAVLDMTIEPRADIRDGAAVKDATLRIDRADQDTMVLPLAGIIGCAPQTVRTGP